MQKILIADDSEIGRTSIRAILLKQHDWVICGEAVNGREAVLMAHEKRPDAIVMDFSMPMMDGLQAAREILRSTPEVAIIIFTFHKSPQLDIEAGRSGIGVISKTDAPAALIEALGKSLHRAAAAGTRSVPVARPSAGIDAPGNPPVGRPAIVADQPVEPIALASDTARAPAAAPSDGPPPNASTEIASEAAKKNEP